MQIFNNPTCTHPVKHFSNSRCNCGSVLRLLLQNKQQPLQSLSFTLWYINFNENLTVSDLCVSILCKCVCGGGWLVSQLVLWAHSITKNSIRAEHKLPLSSSYSFHKSSYHKSWFKKKFFLAYLYSVGTQHGNLPLAGWPILFCRPTQEPCVSHRKNWERFWKKYRWMDRKGKNY